MTDSEIRSSLRSLLKSRERASSSARPPEDEKPFAFTAPPTTESDIKLAEIAHRLNNPPRVDCPEIRNRLKELAAEVDRLKPRVWKLRDHSLRRYSIRGRSQSSPDELKSNRLRSFNRQPLRQWRDK